MVRGSPLAGAAALSVHPIAHIHRLPLVRAAAGPYTGVIRTCLRASAKKMRRLWNKALARTFARHAGTADRLQERCALLSQPARSGSNA